MSTVGSGSAERMFELRDQIVGALDADREPHEAVADSELRSHRWRQARMRHEPRVLDEALDPAEALGEREKLAPLQKSPGILERSLQLRAHDPAESAPHLSFRELVLRMARKAGVVNAGDLRMGPEEAGDGERVGAVPLHAHGQSLDAAQDEKAIECARHVPEPVLQKFDPFGKIA